MWIKDKESQESYIHICDGLTEKQMKEKAIGIWLHDIHIFTFTKSDDEGVKIEYVKYCPYCGCQLKDTTE